MLDERGNPYVATFPEGVSRPVQYGNSIKTQAVYMSYQQLLPYDRIRDYFTHQCDIKISTGTLCNFNREAFDLLTEFESIVQRQLVKQRVLHADETGINVNGKCLWLHNLSNDQWTLYFPHEKRGMEAIVAMGILMNFEGILCHDHWKPYFKLTCQHALCNAHHLRELERAWEQDGQHWANEMKDLLLEMNKATEQAGGCLPDEAAEQFRSRYQITLALAEHECPPPVLKNQPGRVAKSKSRNLLERLRAFEAETLRFMTDKLVPFTNNQGENDLRMTKVQQKISGCFRAFDGAKYFCRTRSYLSTCRKHGLPPTDALQILFSGQLPDFITKLE